ncbi:uncharacterized protein LOC121972496 [Zingiber officinale]|uniref:uncharacterized protein LOC121972496 n=1 Tax=Zingiber officinale TaxID=94328 RepID=UPI001C4C6A5F|nr:uncharacterized protein LOC121972496 [Zingiber officinale]
MDEQESESSFDNEEMVMMSSEGALNKKWSRGKRGEGSGFIGKGWKQVANRVGQGERRRVHIFWQSRAQGRQIIFPFVGFAMHSCEVLQMTMIAFLLELGKGSGIGMVIEDMKME